MKCCPLSTPASCEECGCTFAVEQESDSCEVGDESVGTAERRSINRHDKDRKVSLCNSFKINYHSLIHDCDCLFFSRSGMISITSADGRRGSRSITAKRPAFTLAGESKQTPIADVSSQP